MTEGYIIDQTEGNDAPRYVIASVSDFFNVPPERRDECLHDFAMWLDIVGSIGDAFGGMVTAPRNQFMWIDDGDHDPLFRVKVAPKERPE